jgi:hypothetical protein
VPASDGRGITRPPLAQAAGNDKRSDRPYGVEIAGGLVGEEEERTLERADVSLLSSSCRTSSGIHLFSFVDNGFKKVDPGSSRG